uniref:Putative methyltransferase n=1 Tax=viral metagenome TaxID=1070528 RepID=A0A6H1Z970_9ZZZZ
MTPELKTIRLSEVVFDEVIYPRKDHDPALVQRYVDVLGEIEAAQKYIAVSSDFKLLDGKHRWLAYRKQSGDVDRDIKVFVYPATAPHDQLKLSAKLNSEHGWQLSEKDKERTAKALYQYGSSFDEIAATLFVGKKKVSEWLSRTVKDNKAKRDAKIREMWLACYTQEEVAEAVGCTQPTVKGIIDDFIKLVSENQNYKDAISAAHATNFDPPIYNVWKQQEKSKGSSHFGNSEARWVDNLLYLYTEPFDVVVDPFAGGGSTIDVCRKRLRRYWVSDRKPIVEREDDIRKHDITTGLPRLPRWQDVRLVYLDPPYWKQAEGEYSDDPEDLANMTLEKFNEELAGLISGFAKKLKGTGAKIALILQPTQWRAPERQYTDHVADMLRTIKLPVEMRIQAPYESQQATAQMVEWAKETKSILVLSREIVVWSVP